MRLIKSCQGTCVLLWLSGLFAVLVVMSTAWMIASDRETTVREVQRDNVLLTEVLEEHARRSFEVSKATLRELSESLLATGSVKVTPAVKARMETLIKDFPQFFAFLLLDAKGNVVYLTLPGSSSATNRSDREYFIAHRDGEDFHVGRMIRGRTSNEWQYSLSKRLVDRDGNFQGVLFIAMPVTYFTALYNRLGLSPTDNIAIAKPDGAMVARRLGGDWAGDVGPSSPGHPLFTEYYPKAMSGTFEATSLIDHIKRFGAYRGVEGWPLLVYSTSDAEVVLTPWRHRSLLIATKATIVLIVQTILTWWGSAIPSFLHNRECVNERLMLGYE